MVKPVWLVCWWVLVGCDGAGGSDGCAGVRLGLCPKMPLGAPTLQSVILKQVSHLFKSVSVGVIRSLGTTPISGKTLSE